MSSPVLKGVVSWRGGRGSGAVGDGTYRAYEEASARVQGLKRGGSRFSKLGGLENQKKFY